MKIDKRIGMFLVLAAIFVTSLIVGDLIGPKLLEPVLFGKGRVISAGLLAFPVTFLLTDLLNEFYGKRAARIVTIVGFFMAIYAYLLVSFAVNVPIAGFTNDASWQGLRGEQFDAVFSGSKRILVASMTAYLIGQFADIFVFHTLKRTTKNKMLWLRATGSTLVSQLIDTVVVSTVAWTGIMSSSQIVEISINSYLVKLLIAIGLTPLIYLGHALVERLLEIKPVVLDEQGEPLPE